MMHTADDQLLKLWIHHRDAEAFSELVSRHAAMVYSICRRIARSKADAEDVAQECFLKLSRVRVGPKSSFTAWLHTMATRLAIDHLRREGRRRRLEQRFAAESTGTQSSEWRDIEPYVDEAIESLPSPLRDVIVAHFIERQTHAKIAETLGITRQAVSSRVRKGIEQVRETLRRRGLLQIGVGSLSTFLSSRMLEASPDKLLASLGKLAVSGAAPAATFVPSTGALLMSAQKLTLAVGLSFVVLLVVALLPWMLRRESGKPVNIDEDVVRTETTRERPMAPRVPEVMPPTSSTIAPTDSASKEEPKPLHKFVISVANGKEGPKIPGAQLYIYHGYDGQGGQHFVAKTDADGELRQSFHPLSRYRFKVVRIVAFAIGHSSAEARLTVVDDMASSLVELEPEGTSTDVTLTRDAGVTQLELVVEPAVSVEGMVLDGIGRPLPGYAVRIYDESTGARVDRFVRELRPGQIRTLPQTEMGSHAPPLLTDENGVFLAEALPVNRGLKFEIKGRWEPGARASTTHQSRIYAEPGRYTSEFRVVGDSTLRVRPRYPPGFEPDLLLFWLLPAPATEEMWDGIWQPAKKDLRGRLRLGRSGNEDGELHEDGSAVLGPFAVSSEPHRLRCAAILEKPEQTRDVQAYLGEVRVPALAAGVVDVDIDIVKPPPQRVATEIVLVDADDNPLPKAVLTRVRRVSLHSTDGSFSSHGGQRDAAGDRFQFRIDARTNGPFEVKTLLGFTDISVPLPALDPSGSHRVRIPLETLSKTSATLTVTTRLGSDGSMLEAQVRFRAPGTLTANEYESPATIRWLPAGEYEVRAFIDPTRGPLAPWQTIELGAGEERVLNLTLIPGRKIEGNLVPANPECPAQVLVTGTTVDGRPFDGSVKAQRNGDFVLWGVPDGRYRVVGSDCEQFFGPTRLLVATGMEVEPLTLNAARSLSRHRLIVRRSPNVKLLLSFVEVRAEDGCLWSRTPDPRRKVESSDEWVNEFETSVPPGEYVVRYCLSSMPSSKAYRGFQTMRMRRVVVTEEITTLTVE